MFYEMIFKSERHENMRYRIRNVSRISKGQSKAVIRNMTDDTMATIKRTKGPMIHKTLYELRKCRNFLLH